MSDKMICVHTLGEFPQPDQASSAVLLNPRYITCVEHPCSARKSRNPTCGAVIHTTSPLPTPTEETFEEIETMLDTAARKS